MYLEMCSDYWEKSILVINQINAQNVFIISLLYDSTCFEHCFAHHQVVKIVLYSIWYHQSCRWPSGAPDGHLLV